MHLLGKILRLLIILTIGAVIFVGIYLIVIGLIKDDWPKFFIGAAVTSLGNGLLSFFEKSGDQTLKQRPYRLIGWLENLEDKITKPVTGWGNILKWLWVIGLFMATGFVLLAIPGTKAVGWIPLIIGLVLFTIFGHLLAALFLLRERRVRDVKSEKGELSN